MNVYALESTTVKPLFESYPPGVRNYNIYNYLEIGMSGQEDISDAEYSNFELDDSDLNMIS